MVVITNIIDKTLIIRVNDGEKFFEVLEDVIDIQRGCAGYENEKNRQKRIIDDLQQQVAELLSEDELE